MTKSQKLVTLQLWADVMKQGDDLLAPVIDVLDLHPEGPITTALWTTQNALTKAVAQLVGDSAEWLSWYAEENGMGTKAMDAGPLGKERPIKTIDDLLWVIEVAA